MQHSYFKIRSPWDFRPHKFEIGPPFIGSLFFENHFFLKLYNLKTDEYEDFYDFHLRHYLENRSGEEKGFHIYVSDIVSTRIGVLKLEDPFSRKALRARENIEQLKAFQKFLNSIDQWKSSEALELVIAEKNEEIAGLKQQISELQNQLQSIRAFEPSTKIDICNKHLPTLIDLIHQLQDLVLPNGRRLLTFQGQSGWYKLLSRYFVHDHNPIPIETARNYFPVKKGTEPIKGSQVPPHLKLFEIVPAQPDRSKR